MRNKFNVEAHLDFTRARIVLGRLQSANDLIAIWNLTGPCIEECPSCEKIQKRKNIS